MVYYQKPNTKGITLIARNGGINGGRSFSLDLDLLHGLHFHTNKLKFLGLTIKSHISFPFAILTGILNGFISIAFAGLMGKVFKVQGINAGRGSWDSVTKQIYTKLNKNIINGITIKTFCKMFGLSMYESMLDILRGILFN